MTSNRRKSSIHHHGWKFIDINVIFRIRGGSGHVDPCLVSYWTTQRHITIPED